MAINYYQLSNGLWAVANWSLGHVPETPDQAIVPATIEVSIAGTDQKGLRPTSLEFARGFKFNIGANGDPLIIDSPKITHYGSGSLWLKSDDNGDAEFTDWVLIDSDNMINAATLDGEYMQRITVQKGNVTLAATLGTVTLPGQVDVTYRNNPSSDAIVTINCALLALTGRLNMMAGLCTTNAAIPIGNATGGIWTHSNVNSRVVTTANISGTGTLRYNSTGVMVTANVSRGGTLDLLNNNLFKTVTTINLFPGGTLIYNEDLFSGTINDLGGTIIKLRDARERAPG